jgi:hypothetical protein
MVEREGQHMGMLIRNWLNEAPWSWSSAVVLGMYARSAPAMSSVRMKTIFGRCAAGGLLGAVLHETRPIMHSSSVVFRNNLMSGSR